MFYFGNDIQYDGSSDMNMMENTRRDNFRNNGGYGCMSGEGNKNIGGKGEE